MGRRCDCCTIVLGACDVPRSALRYRLTAPPSTPQALYLAGTGLRAIRGTTYRLVAWHYRRGIDDRHAGACLCCVGAHGTTGLVQPTRSCPHLPPFAVSSRYLSLR